MCQKFSRRDTIIEFIKDMNVYHVYLIISKNANFNSYGAFRTIFTQKGGYFTFLEVDTSSISVPVSHPRRGEVAPCIKQCLHIVESYQCASR